MQVSNLRDQDHSTPLLDSTPTRPRSTAAASFQGAIGTAAGLLVPNTGLRVSFAQDATPVTAGPVAVDGFIRSTVDGVPDVYLQLPAPFASTSDPPGAGGTVRAFTISCATPGPGRDDNQDGEELERPRGVTWEVDQTSQAGYGEKAATYLAGGDLPDLFSLDANPGAPQLYQTLIQGAFTDLTPCVTGDALQRF